MMPFSDKGNRVDRENSKAVRMSRKVNQKGYNAGVYVLDIREAENGRWFSTKHHVECRHSMCYYEKILDVIIDKNII